MLAFLNIRRQHIYQSTILNNMKIPTFKSVSGLLLVTIFLFSWEPKKKEVVKDPLPEQPKNTLFTLVSPDSSGINFLNKVVNQENFNIFKYRNFYNGGGVAIGDINNDGLPGYLFHFQYGARNYT